ncbi:peptidoglycan-binding domain-containing protein [Telmatobacter bradus]|uniref:peptidoglycan-binding domain-containing protein n=1 Tax=Telmatobacter bradus TaxID=474953 RepID=UPI003B436885
MVQASASTHRMHGQQGIDPERATQIQQALIREHYLTGEASGHWDSDTAAAMQKFQADQGWQTKLMPDSRALKKLGLGPDYSNAINAKTGNFVDPPPLNSIPSNTIAGFTAGSGVKD